jgi:hypothetical protein
LKVLTATSGHKGDSRFRKYLWKLANRADSPLLVHYVGDERIYEPFSHGNATKNANQPYHRTAKVIAEKSKASVSKHPQEAYEEILAESRPELSYQPRNRKQIENFQDSLLLPIVSSRIWHPFFQG